MVPQHPSSSNEYSMSNNAASYLTLSVHEKAAVDADNERNIVLIEQNGNSSTSSKSSSSKTSSPQKGDLQVDELSESNTEFDEMESSLGKKTMVSLSGIHKALVELKDYAKKSDDRQQEMLNVMRETQQQHQKVLNEQRQQHQEVLNVLYEQRQQYQEVLNEQRKQHQEVLHALLNVMRSSQQQHQDLMGVLIAQQQEQKQQHQDLMKELQKQQNNNK
ncbi:hypothetical protein C9374_010974 [Naegleria lovaniensis]|uniref:Uncharacterized protein n=1 Tax=Naegleria lovaniensis TaxID=51637 RepID=A0AA88KFB8_NAELO|nr:uncharacterized protein C9374_010974 [Naegleria lovaniensis]KAG2374404.1 hypothetical protein C9374_010974 [Naegleria lovaniensis]